MTTESGVNEMDMAKRQKQNARLKTWRAVQAGKIIPTNKCEHCGCPPVVCKDGRHGLQAHHHKGYDDKNIFDVIWLCPSCHKLSHPEESAWTDEAKAKLSKTLTGKSLSLSEDERNERRVRCKIVKPWEFGRSPECPNGHGNNFGKDNRGSRFCRTCANERRRISRKKVG